MTLLNPSVFISYSHADKDFARKLAADLKVSGASVWIDEAELRVGDSLIDAICKAIDKVEFLAAILSPASITSRWVQEELQQALTLQIEERQLKLLPILLADCALPGFIRTRLYADFRDRDLYEDSLERLLHSIGIQHMTSAGALIVDPLARKYGRTESFMARPKLWFCVRCGAKSEIFWDDRPYNYCRKCKSERPYIDGEQTIEQCHRCNQLNIAGAAFCEWCGEPCRLTLAISGAHGP